MTSDERLYALRVDIYAEIGYHLGIDDSDDGACDAKNRAALGVLRLIERELADAEALAARIEAAWEWIARTEPHPELNGDLLRGLRDALSGSGDPGPKLNPLAVAQRKARRAAGERDTAELSPFAHCPHCRRPVPHNEVEARACRTEATG